MAYRICQSCVLRLVPPPHPRCDRCEAPRGSGLPPDRGCGDCDGWPDGLRVARSACLLRTPADRLVHELKYGGWPELGGALAVLMSKVAIPGLPSLAGVPIVPVPTTPERLRERGYNQAERLARGLALGTGGTLTDALLRREGGGSQVALQREERRANVQGVFALREVGLETLQERDVLVVDDVLTTGATASAVSEVLLSGGARSVSVLTFARTLPDPAGPS